MRRQSTARVALALVGALLIAGLSACAPSPDHQELPTQLPQAALLSILITCSESSGVTGGAEFHVLNGAVTVTEPGGSPSLESPLTRLSTCLARYPVDAGYTDAPRPAYLLMVLDYEVNVLTPCLKAEGYAIAPPPSRGEYLTGTFWTAYQSVELDDLDRWVSLATQCPPKPAYLRGGH